MRNICLLLLFGLTGSQSKSQTWIWGRTIPEKMEDILDFSDHGFIRIQSSSDDSLQISLVKRPPHDLYSENEKFCSSMVPAAIAEFMDGSMMDRLTSVFVSINAHPYRAACKCYMRTLISMGMNRIGEGSGIVVGPDRVEEYCDYKHESITGRPVVVGGFGNSPMTDSIDTDREKLRQTSSFVLVERENGELVE
jgi:hypothetical protein